MGIFIIIIFLFGVYNCLTQFVYVKKYDEYKKNISIILSVILIIIATFRTSEMRDYLNYYEFFLNGSADWKEPSFKIITTITSESYINPLWGFFIFSFLSIVIKMYDIIKLSPFFWGSFIVWIGSIFILHDMIQIRAAVASGILIWSIKYIYYRNYSKFIVCIFVATAFHYSSIIFSLLYFISSNKTRKNLYLLLIPLSYLLLFSGITFGNLVSIIHIPSIQTLYNFYRFDDEPLNIFNSFQLLRILTAIFLISNIERIKNEFPLSVILIKIYIIGICALILLSDITTLAIRTSELILAIEILAVPLVIFIPKKKYIILGKIYTIGYSSFFLIMEIFYLNYLPI